MPVLNKHHGNLPADAIYIGRGSDWGNPYVMQDSTEEERSRVCDAFENQLLLQLGKQAGLVDMLKKLHGKPLVCFCAPKRCHGHTLERYAKQLHTPRVMGPYRLLIAGSRDFTNTDSVIREVVRLALNEVVLHQIEIVSGTARGADQAGEEAAQTLGLNVHRFPADWDTHGRSAGYRRNETMGDFADGALIFWDGQSRGTQHMITTMRKLHKPCRVIHY